MEQTVQVRYILLPCALKDLHCHTLYLKARIASSGHFVSDIMIKYFYNSYFIKVMLENILSPYLILTGIKANKVISTFNF